MQQNEEMKMEPKLIDLNDYVLFGGGFLGDSYNHKSDPDVMLKLYSAERTKMAWDEYDCARKVYALGIPTPEPGQLVKVQDGRTGIIFRRIPGKKSFAKAIGENPSQTEEFAEKFALMCKDLHATKVNKEDFPNKKDYCYEVIKDSPYLTSAQKDKVVRFITDVPEADTALHGDLHFGNVICRGSENWFIDLGGFSHGYYLFDLGMTMITMRYSTEEGMRKLYHMEQSTAVRFWEAFVKYYFGPGCSLEDIEEEIKPYGALRTLLIQKDLGHILPVRQPLVDSLIK